MKKKLHICFYISDHGFGHAMRCASIMEELISRGVKITSVCGKAQTEAIQRYLGNKDVNYRIRKTDVGLILHPGTLEVDISKTQEALKTYLINCRQIVESESTWLRDECVDIGVCDMPIWSIEACQLAEVPLQYIGNFTWAEIYREYFPKRIWTAYTLEYQKLDAVMLYALHNSKMLDIFSNSCIKSVSLTSRKFSNVEAFEIRKRHKQPLIFVSLGMAAKFTETVDVSSYPYDFITNQGVPLTGNNVEYMNPMTIDSQNLILASDYVITKAGWSTVAEAILAHKKIALFSRDAVLEDRETIRILKSQLLAIEILQEDLKNIDKIIQRMDSELKSDNFQQYYDSKGDIADQIISLAQNK